VDLRPRSYTFFFHFFPLFSLDPKKVKKIAVTHENFPTQKTSFKSLTPKVYFSYFHFGPKGGLWRPPGKVPIVQDPLKPLTQRQLSLHA